MKVGECRYAMMTDEKGHVINDPVVLKLADDRYWFSIADSDVLFWAKGLALGRGLNVRVSEAPVSPLAVQGPKSTDLMRDLFGSWVDDLKFYHFRETDLDGIPMLLARSGWSPERGYELYLQDESRGDELWERVMAAGQKYSISPGVPNHTRRMEGGLLVYGCDITSAHSVLELGLPPKWCSGDKAADFMGKAAIRELIESGGPQRRVVGLEFLVAGAGVGELDPLVKPWKIFRAVDEKPSDIVVGHVSSACFSPTLEAHIAIATVTSEKSNPGDEVYVETPTGCRHAVVRKLPFMPRAG
jgi:aminomethyltransferase